MKISKTLITENEITEKVKFLAAQINADYKDKELYVIGILNGSFIFMADLIRELNIDLKVEFMGISSYPTALDNSTTTQQNSAEPSLIYQDGTDSTGKLLITKDIHLNLNAVDVLVVEDIIDSGVTAARLVEMLKSRNPRSIKVCALLNKQSRRVNNFSADYVGFEIEDEFVVGYGLDCAGKFRQMKNIGVIEL